jgi:hypothetical protein
MNVAGGAAASSAEVKQARSLHWTVLYLTILVHSVISSRRRPRRHDSQYTHLFNFCC